MSKQLETFVRNNRDALDTASPDPAIWDEINAHTIKTSKFSLMKFFQRLRGWFFA